ncbi:Neutral ceramidase precursor [Phycisphaerae bacterium RAS1]|nr:Neutral ceramidase precursor [Phycisphaerae bacterium RAS1]
MRNSKDLNTNPHLLYVPRRVCGAISTGLLAALSGCPATTSNEPHSPAVEIRGASGMTLRIGAAAQPITPPGVMALAGGTPYRLSAGVHDDLWARAIVVDDGAHRVALVSLDLIGLDYDDVVRCREDVAAVVDVDYVLIASTHTHSAPDLIGAWALLPNCGDDPYRQLVGQGVAQAVAAAAADLTVARLVVASGPAGDPPLSRDVRPPEVIDDRLTVWQARDAVTDEVICTAVHFAVHPILVPSISPLVSSDFPHYLRQAVESGWPGDVDAGGNIESITAQGGVCLFLNGALAGRITPRGTERVASGATDDLGFDRAQGFGYRLAQRALALLETQAETVDVTDGVGVSAAPIRVPLTNPALAAAASTCIIHRPVTDGSVASEVAVVSFGPLEFFAVPGMIFPELVLGPVAPAAGSDFGGAAFESPTLGTLARGRYSVTIGLANDLLGYIIPRSQWDAEAPFITSEAPYGEAVSPGPDTAAVVLEAFAELPR